MRVAATRWMRFVFVVLVVCVGPGVAAKGPAGPPPVPPPKPYDISKFKDKLQVLHDGKEHYFVLLDIEHGSLSKVKDAFFYGDGKTFYRQYSPSGGRNKKDYSFTVGDPRVLYPARSIFEAKKGVLTFTCEKRETVLQPLERDKAVAMLDQAKFYDVYWTRTAHALARDDRGNYYYVDRLVADDYTGSGHRGFRVFRGMRGKMRQLRMKNVVSDVKGEIFTTNRGQLRLIIPRGGTPGEGKGLWIAGKRRVNLTAIPVRDLRTRVMIYRELGAYTGLKLHKPCDDL
jgi:hypothetical protein